MTDWRAVLRQDDERMAPQRAREIRTSVVVAARAAAAPRPRLAWRVAAIAFVLAFLAAGVGDHRRASDSVPGTDKAAPDPVIPSGERRQIQFATPGGTRIIWELNPEFSLMETLP